MAHRSIQKGVRITYVGKDVSNINFLVRQREGQEDETVYHFPSDEIARQYITHEPERMPREAFVLPEKSIADELVEAYFKKINPGCPIVDEDIFMGQYRSRNPADPPSLLVLQAILLVGAHVSRERPDRDTLKATFFRRAKMLFDARLEKNRDVVVQAALLLTWHSDGEEDIGANAWYWVGIAARIATGLGMHRDAGSSTLVNHDLRTWRRTWWILVQFDVMVALSHGRPQAM
jgi:transcriptional regulatory protein AMDR